MRGSEEWRRGENQDSSKMNKSLRAAIKSRKFAQKQLAAAKREARKIIVEARKEIIAADKALGAALRNLRKEKHIGSPALQKMTGLRQGTISGIETGHVRISDRSLNKILEALEVG